MNSKRGQTFFLYLVLVVVLVTCCLLPSAECRRRRKQTQTTADGNWDLGTGSDAQQLAKGLAEIQKIKSDAISSFKYCYRDTYGRGSRMADCPTDYINDGATCRRPPSTYSQPSRMADCPGGFTNMGATCYRWWPPKSLSWDSMSCHGDEFRSGGRCYRYCKAGYTNTGEFCDRPLNVLGLDRMTCSGEFSEKTGGRCYRPCRPGFSSDGLEICWATCPSGWTNCGASCDKEGTKGCAEKIGMQVFNGVVAAGSIAALIVSAGSAAPAIEAADMAKAASKGSKILSRLKQVKKVIDKVTAAYGAFEEAMKVAEFASQISAEQTKEAKLLLGTIDTATTLLDVLEMADPTGLVSLGRSLMAPKCDQLETAWVVFTILGS